MDIGDYWWLIVGIIIIIALIVILIVLKTQLNRDKKLLENNGEKVPITEKVTIPKVEGAIVLAEGANDANIKNNIILAVEAVTGLSTHKIQVFQLKS